MAMKKMFIVLAAAGVIALMYSVSPYGQTAVTEPVSLVQPSVRTVRETVTLHGSVIDPERKKVYPEGTCRVEKVFVAQGDLVTKGQLLMRLEKQSSIQDEQAAAAAALGELKESLENGDFSGAESMMDGWMAYYEKGAGASESDTQFYNIYSPVTGMVMKLPAKEGQQISGFLPCIEISSLTDLVVEAEAGEDVIGKLKENLSCTVSVPAFSVSGLHGYIKQIMPYAQQTGLFTGDSTAKTTVRIAIPDQEGELRPGYRATAHVVVASRTNAVLIPYEAVAQDEAGNEYVMKLRENRAVKQIISTGSELGNEVEILSGVLINDILICHPETVSEGEVIRLAS